MCKLLNKFTKNAGYNVIDKSEMITVTTLYSQVHKFKSSEIHKFINSQVHNSNADPGT